MIKLKFNITTLNKKELIWNKNVPYYENQYFFEIDLNNPNIPNDFSFLTEMILFIIKNKPVASNKHLIILKNIDRLGEYAFAFRIILEKFYNNVYFICTTHKKSKIESPIISRFSLIRLRLFTNEEIKFIDYKNNCNQTVCNTKLLNNSNTLHYTKFLHVPQTSGQHTTRIQRKCVRPLNYQKPYPGPTNGDACNGSIEVNKNIVMEKLKNKEVEIFLSTNCN